MPFYCCEKKEEAKEDIKRKHALERFTTTVPQHNAALLTTIYSGHTHRQVQPNSLTTITTGLYSQRAREKQVCTIKGLYYSYIHSLIYKTRGQYTITSLYSYRSARNTSHTEVVGRSLTAVDFESRGLCTVCTVCTVTDYWTVYNTKLSVRVLL